MKTVVANDTPPMCHSATLTQVSDGRLLCVWYAGSYECADDTELHGSYTDKHGNWEPPRPIMSFPGHAVGNPVLDANLSSHELTLYFVVISGSGWTDSLLVCIKSSDDGKTWSTPVLVTPERGIMCRSRMLRMRNGTLLLPVYHERQWIPLVLKSRDDGLSWTMRGDTTMSGRAIQPTLTELSDGGVAMYMRTTAGNIFVSHSFNGGESWTAACTTPLPNPNSSISVIRMSQATLIMAYNPSSTTRNTLAIATSDDDGQSWSAPHVIATSKHGEYSYPTLFEDNKAKIHLVFTSNRVAICHDILARVISQTTRS